MNTLRPTAACVCALALLGSVAGTSSALADTSNHARVVVTPNAAGDWPTDISVQQAGACSSSATGAGGYNSSGSGAASAAYGTVTLSGAASGSLTTYTSGTCHDGLTFNAPGVAAGTAGTLTFTVEVDGELTATSGGSIANWRLTADLGGDGLDIDKSAQLFGPVTPVPGYWGDSTGTYSATVNIQFGVSTPLSLGLVAVARAAYSDMQTPGAASIGAPFTARWMGINAVTIGGTPVAAYTVTSETGTDYRGISTPPAACAADIGSGGGLRGPDGALDSNDFIVFISCFFGQESPADMGMVGGVTGADGRFDNNDFIAFITRFFSGC